MVQGMVGGHFGHIIKVQAALSYAELGCVELIRVQNFQDPDSGNPTTRLADIVTRQKTLLQNFKSRRYFMRQGAFQEYEGRDPGQGRYKVAR